jgi:HPt (histidine-containing phosphotransfer) domain-containing protein
MDGYVSKPLRPEELFGVIDDLFASEPLADAVPGAGPAAVEHALDSAALLSGFSGNKKLLGEVIDVFLADSPGLMMAIRQAVAQHDRKALAASAHALKGSIGLFVQQDAYQTARGLERAAAGGDLTGVHETCATLEEEMAVLRERLGDLRKAL